MNNNRYIYIGNDLIAGRDTWGNCKREGYMKMIDGKVTDYETYLRTLPKIEVNGTHSWEINQILVEDVDFEFEYAPVTKMNGSQSARLVAVPISKPNTDVKENLLASVQNSEGSSLATLSSSSSNSIEQDWKEKFDIWDNEYYKKHLNRPPFQEICDWIEEYILAPLLEEKRLNEDIIRNQHSIMVNAEQRGIEKAKEELNACQGFCLADILLPGATLDDLGGEIDINDPETQKLLKDSVERQRQILASKNIDYEQLHKRITI